MNNEIITALIILLPLIGSLLLAVFSLFGKNNKTIRIISATTSVAAICISLLFSLYSALTQFPEHAGRAFLFPWMDTDLFTISASFIIDPLSLSMGIFVLTLSLLIHLYSIEYMRNSNRYISYFSLLNFFTGMMLVFVYAENLLISFIGWEGIGAASYLLIGFYTEKKEAVQASYKAFLYNRIGDAGIILGLLVVFGSLGYNTNIDLSFAHINESVKNIAGHTFFGMNAADAAALLFLIGIAAKSAQLPFAPWIPSAMTGPAPVSALIHAAALVTAGVYLTGRLFPFLSESQIFKISLTIIASAGSVYGALLALYSKNIKKILAYSTISQIGIMLLGASAGSFSSAYFHLITHGFFKALLFLCAGSIILLFGEENIKNMGGLYKSNRLLAWSYLIGALSLSGIFPFSGFFSKDAIYLNILEHTGEYPYLYISKAAFLIAAFLTPAYIFRQYAYIFLREKTKDIQTSSNFSLLILIPASLAGMSLFLPFLNFSDSVFPGSILHAGFTNLEMMGHFGASSSLTNGILLSITALLGAVFGFLIVLRPGFSNITLPNSILEFLEEEMYVERVSKFLLQKPIQSVQSINFKIEKSGFQRINRWTLLLLKKLAVLSAGTEKVVLNRIITIFTGLVLKTSSQIRNIQTGSIHNYLQYLAAGALSAASILILMEWN